MWGFVRALLWPFIRRLRHPYHPITVTSEQEFWKLAARVGLPRFRIFRRPLSVAQVEAEMGLLTGWQAVKQSLRTGDKIWPFEFNRYSSGYRKGIVVMRGGEAVTGILTTVS
jgi:hypothetical protein